jgi:hypothetical protein
MNNAKVISKEILDRMEWEKRTSGDEYVVYNDGDRKLVYKDGEMQDFFHEIHNTFSKMPDDNIYEEIYHQLCNISECDTDGDLEDVAQDHEDQWCESEAYTINILKWLSSSLDYVDYMTQAIREYGADDGYQVLSTANFIWKRDVLLAVVNNLEYVEVTKNDEEN